MPIKSKVCLIVYCLYTASETHCGCTFLLSFSVFSNSISASTKSTLKVWEEESRNQASPFHCLWSELQEGNIFIPSLRTFPLHKPALCLVQAVVLYGWKVQIKVRVKFPLEKDIVHRVATTFTFSYCKILIKKRKSTPKRALHVYLYSHSAHTHHGVKLHC